MIIFKKHKNILVLSYYTDEYSDRFTGEDNWVHERFKNNQNLKLKGTFQLSKNQLLPKIQVLECDEFDEDANHFIIGELISNYYQLFETVFSTSNKFFIHESIELNEKFFVAIRKTSIISKVDEQSSEDVYIGPNKKDNLPELIYFQLIKEFPNYHETKLYIQARVSAVISDYIKTDKDKEIQYNRYLNKKLKVHEGTLLKTFKDYEIFKLGTIKDKLMDMLNNEDGYSEKQWQNEIIEILLLLFPKYIAVFQEVKFKDIYSNVDRSLDYGLVDSLGYLDIIEIKIPFRKTIVSKIKYRDNYVPLRNLSGSIMQIEKYIYYLNKTGKHGEKRLTEKYGDLLPDGLQLKITNPKGMIIMGRTSVLNAEQIHDFEIIKRKYKNVIDIFTYDDLLKRLKTSIEQVKKI